MYGTLILSQLLILPINMEAYYVWKLWNSNDIEALYAWNSNSVTAVNIAYRYNNGSLLYMEVMELG